MKLMDITELAAVTTELTVNYTLKHTTTLDTMKEITIDGNRYEIVGSYTNDSGRVPTEDMQWVKERDSVYRKTYILHMMK